MNVWTTNWKVLWRKGSCIAWACPTGGLGSIGKKYSLNTRLNVTWVTGVGHRHSWPEGDSTVHSGNWKISSGAKVQGKMRKVWGKAWEDSEVSVALPRLLFHPLSLVCCPFIINIFLWNRAGYKWKVIIPSCITSWLHQTLHGIHCTHLSPSRLARVHRCSLTDPGVLAHSARARGLENTDWLCSHGIQRLTSFFLPAHPDQELESSS